MSMKRFPWPCVECKNDTQRVFTGVYKPYAMWIILANNDNNGPGNNRLQNIGEDL